MFYRRRTLLTLACLAYRVSLTFRACAITARAPICIAWRVLVELEVSRRTTAHALALTLAHGLPFS